MGLYVLLGLSLLVGLLNTVVLVFTAVSVIRVRDEISAFFEVYARANRRPSPPPPGLNEIATQQVFGRPN